MMQPIQRKAFKLSAPVQAHGETIDTLLLRQPTAGDIAASGEPFVIKNLVAMAEAAETDAAVMPEFAWNMAAALQLFSRLADVPRSAVAAISMGDLYRLQMEVAGFFMQQFATGSQAASANDEPLSAQQTGSMPASTSPGSGTAIPPISLRSVGAN
jgi:hypothetical protein